MAYNNSKGPRGFGDIKNEDDVDTQIDFESDSIGFKTNNIARFVIDNSSVSSSVDLESVGNSFLGGNLNLSGNFTMADKYVDISEMSAPGSPASNFGRLYVADDGGTTKLYFKDSAGSATDLLAGGSSISQANAGNNRVVTSVDATNVNAEANLTFDGDTLKAVGYVTSSLGVSSLSGSFEEGVAVGGSTIISADKDITNVRSLTASTNIYAANGYFTGILDVEGNVVLGNAASDITTITGRLTASQGLSVNVDDYPIVLGAGEDLSIKHDGNSKIKNTSGHITIDNEATSKDIRFVLASDSADTEAVKIRNNSNSNVWACDAAGNVSGSGTLQTVGNTFLGAALEISGATSAQAITATTYSGSSTLQNVGAAILGSTLAVSGTVSVADKIDHAGDADTFISFTDDDINFQAGGVNFMDLTEDTQNEVTFNEGGVDVDFRVETADESHMLFIEGSSNRMSIGDNTGSPGATLEIKNHASAGATGVPLLQLNNNDTDQQCVDINAGNIDANVVNITANDVTTARVLAIGADGLTTGNALYVDDNSSNTGTRNTALIIQNNAAAINAKALAIQSDGGKTGVKIDKNYSDTTEASVVGLDIDWDKTGASTSDNTMYGIQIDMDNTTATNGNNTMYGIHVTPTLTHAANAGTPIVYGALINAQGGTNGTSLVQGARIEAGGGDINYGIQLDVEDGGVDLRIESSADSGDYFQIQTTTHGATTITTVDDDATAANLTFTIDGDITLDPAGGDVIVDGNISGSGTFQAAGNAFFEGTLNVSGACSSSAGLSGLSLTIGGAGNRGFDEDAGLSVNGINNNSAGISNAGSVAGATTISGSGAVSGFTGTFEGGLTVGGSVVITEDKVLQNVTTNFSALSASGGVSGLTLTVGGAGNRGFDEDAQLSCNAVNVNSGGITNAGAIAGATTISGSGEISGFTADFEGGYQVGNTTVITEDKQLRARQVLVTRHHYENGSNANFKWISFSDKGDVNFANAVYTNSMVAPFNGRLVRVLAKFEDAQDGNVILTIHTGSGLTVSSQPFVEDVVVSMPNDANSVGVFNTTGSQHFTAGSLIGIGIDPAENPGRVSLSCIWEYDMTGL